MEPADAKELIDEAIDRAEEERGREVAGEREREKRFRDRVSILVGVFAVLLAIVHVAAAGTARASLLGTVEASDAYAYMQAKIVRETVLETAAAGANVAAADRAALLDKARRLRAPDRAGHGIGQLRAQGDALRERGRRAAEIGERYEWGETALQVAIVLLSIALVAQSRRIVVAAIGLASLGLILALSGALGAS